MKVSSPSGVLGTNSQSNVQLHDKKNAQKLELSYFDQRLSPVYLDYISNTKEAMGEIEVIKSNEWKYATVTGV